MRNFAPAALLQVFFIAAPIRKRLITLQKLTFFYCSSRIAKLTSVNRGFMWEVGWLFFVKTRNPFSRLYSVESFREIYVHVNAQTSLLLWETKFLLTYNDFRSSSNNEALSWSFALHLLHFFFRKLSPNSIDRKRYILFCAKMQLIHRFVSVNFLWSFFIRVSCQRESSSFQL